MRQSTLLNNISRHPTLDAMACKSVCKPWLGAVETHSESYDIIEFVETKTTLFISAQKNPRDSKGNKTKSRKLKLNKKKL